MIGKGVPSEVVKYLYEFLKVNQLDFDFKGNGISLTFRDYVVKKNIQNGRTFLWCYRWVGISIYSCF